MIKTTTPLAVNSHITYRPRCKNVQLPLLVYKSSLDFMPAILHSNTYCMCTCISMYMESYVHSTLAINRHETGSRHGEQTLMYNVHVLSHNGLRKIIITFCILIFTERVHNW